MTGGDPFAGVFLTERPTAAELVALLESQGYAVRVTRGTAALTQVHKGGDRAVVQAVALVLKNEPYRSAVLGLCGNSAVQARAAPALEMAEPEQDDGKRCRTCKAVVWGEEVICGRAGCPYRRVTRGDPQALVGHWKPWKATE